MNKAITILIAVVVLAAVGVGAFYAGTKVGEQRAQQNLVSQFQTRVRGQGGQFPGQGDQFPSPVGTPQAGRGGAQVFAGGTMGTIEKIEGNVVTISNDEGTIRVQTTDTTLIEKNMSVQVGDLKLGEQVVVSGSSNDDGSLTARSIRSVQGMQFPQSGQ